MGLSPPGCRTPGRWTLAALPGCPTPGRGALAASCILAAVAALPACASRAAGLPPGPPPEYERVPLPPWDGGVASTPEKSPAPTEEDPGFLAPKPGASDPIPGADGGGKVTGRGGLR